MTVVEPKVNLLDLSDEAFNALVNQDVRGSLNPETSHLLRDPVVAERWYDTLLTLKRSVEGQLSANRAEQAQKQAEYLSLGPHGRTLWMQERAAAEKWRSGAVRFKHGVEDRMAEAKKYRSHARTAAHAEIVAQERDEALTELRGLRQAILQHRDHVCGNDCGDTCSADDLLWSAVS